MFIVLVWIHWFADFLCQWDQMAIQKSKSIGWLFVHCLIYSICFLYFGWKFALLNGLVHFVIDFFTSRINAKLYLNHRHWFFTMIGFDQALHLTTLFIIYRMMK